MFGIRLTEERVYVQSFLDRARALIPTGQCTFRITEKNKQFDRKYNMTDQQKRNVVRSLCIDDFVEIRLNEVPRYPEAELFVFCKTMMARAMVSRRKSPCISKNILQMRTIWRW